MRSLIRGIPLPVLAFVLQACSSSADAPSSTAGSAETASPSPLAAAYAIELSSSSGDRLVGYGEVKGGSLSVQPCHLELPEIGVVLPPLGPTVNVRPTVDDRALAQLDARLVWPDFAQSVGVRSLGKAHATMGDAASGGIPVTAKLLGVTATIHALIDVTIAPNALAPSSGAEPHAFKGTAVVTLGAKFLSAENTLNSTAEDNMKAVAGLMSVMHELRFIPMRAGASEGCTGAQEILHQTK